MNWLKIGRYVLLFGVIGLAVYRLWPHFGDFEKIFSERHNIVIYWVFAAVFVQMLQYFADGWLSQVLLLMLDMRPRLKDTIRIASLTVFAAHLLPVGEVGGSVAAYSFYKKLGVSTQNFLFLALSWGFLMNVALFLLLILPIFFLPNVVDAIHVSVTVLVILNISLVLLVIMILNGRYVYRFFKKILGRYSWSSELFALITNRNEYFRRIINHPRLLLAAVIATFLYYAANIASLTFSFLAFGIMPPLPIVVFAFAASLVFGRVTLAPGGIGATEASLALIFIQSGMDPTATLAAVLLFRIISFWLPIPAGFVSYVSMNKQVANRSIT